MATQAQIEANRRNAQRSTGPRTEAGKANSSRNATRFGLFSTNNCVLPGEEEFYDHFCHTLWDSLAPVGPIEELTAGEYVRAAWLLRRCVLAAQRLGEYAVRCRAEDNLQYKQDLPVSDPMLRDDCLPSEAAIARAHAQAFNCQRRAKADLDKLQAERRARPPVPAEPAAITEPTQSVTPAVSSTPDLPGPAACNIVGPGETTIDHTTRDPGRGNGPGSLIDGR